MRRQRGFLGIAKATAKSYSGCKQVGEQQNEWASVAEVDKSNDVIKKYGEGGRKEPIPSSSRCQCHCKVGRVSVRDRVFMPENP